MPFDFGLGYDPTLIDTPPGSNISGGLGLDSPASTTTPNGGMPLDWGKLLALAVEGAAAGYQGKTPQGPALLMKQQEMARQKDVEQEKLQLEKMKTVPHLLDSLSKTSAMIADPETAKQVAPIFQKLFKDVAGVDYDPHIFENLLTNPGQATAAAEMWPELAKELSPRAMAQLAKNPAEAEKLLKRKEEQWANDSYDTFNRLRENGAINKDVTLDQANQLLPKSKYWTDEQKLRLGFPTKATMEAAAKAKDENKSPSVGADREALAQERGFKSFAEAPKDKKVEINKEVKRREDERLALQRIVVNNTTSNSKIDNESAMRKEFEAQSKTFKDVSESYSKIQASANNPSPAGDLSLIFAYMKLLDPVSVVREGEQATAENARSVPDSIRNLYNKVMTGQKLTPEQRKDFVNRAGGLYNAAESSHKQRVSEFRRVAASQGLNPSNVIVEMGSPSTASGGVQRSTSKSGKPIVSRDGGKTWEYE